MDGLRTAFARAVRVKPIASGSAPSGLRRCLRTVDVVGFGLGATIGAGIFVAIGTGAKQAGPGVTLSFLLAALGCSFSGLCYAELSTLAPSAGSSYSFSYFAVGECTACVVGLVNIAGNVLAAAAVARGWEGYTRLFLLKLGVQPPEVFGGFHLGPFQASPVAALLIVVIVAINFLGTKATSAFNNVVTFASVTLLCCFIAGAAPYIEPANWQPMLPHGTHGVVEAAGTVFFAFLGFDVLATLGEEAEHPNVVPRGIVLTLLLSGILYCATGLVFTGLVSYPEIEVTAPLARAADLRGLHRLAVAVSAGAVGNTLTTVIGGVLGGPRICYVMAQDGLLPKSLAGVNRFGAPAQALLVTGFPTAICALLVEFAPLAEIVSAGALCSFSLVCAALVLLRYPCSDSDDVVTGVASVQPAVLGRPTHEGFKVVVEEAECASPSRGKVSTQLYTPPLFLLLSLGAYGLLCLSTGLLLRMNHELLGSGTIPLATGLSAIGAIAAAIIVACPFCARARPQVSEGFRQPLMPLLPMLGILLNMMLLSQLSVQALLRSLLVVLLGLVFYFGYAAPRSRLNDVEQVLVTES